MNQSKLEKNISQRLNDLLRSLISQFIQQDQDIQAAKVIIAENIKEYQEAIKNKCKDYLNKKQIISLIANIKSCGQLASLLEQQSRYPIHSYALKTQRNNFKFVKIFNYSFQQDCRSVQHCIQAVGKMENDLIQDHFEFQDNIEDFVTKIFSYLQDCIFRKCKDSLFNFIQKIQQKVKNEQQSKVLSPQFQGQRIFRNQVLQKISIHDVICLMLMKTSQKFRIAYQLHKIDLPIPIYFQIPNDSKPQQICNFQLFEQLILTEKFQNIILNIGGQSTIKSGKSQFISKIYFLQQKIGQYAGHFKKSSIQIYSNLFKQASKVRNLVIDVNGSVEKSENSFKQIVQKLLSISNIIIYHQNFKKLQATTPKPQVQSQIWIKQQYARFKGAQKKFIIMVHFDRRNIITRFSDKDLPKALILPLNPNLQQSDIDMLRSKIFSQIQNVIKANTEILISQKLKSKVNHVLYKLVQEKQKSFPFTKQLSDIYQLENQIYKIDSSIILFELEQGKNAHINQILKIEELNKKIQARKAIIKSQSPEMLFISSNLRQKKQIQILSKAIQNWKESNILPIEERYAALAAQLLQQKMKLANQQIQRKQKNRQRSEQLQKRINQYKRKQQQLKKIEEAKDEKDISIQSIYLEFIFSDQTLKTDKHKSFISNIYLQSFKNKKPCNIINGKTLSFGNIYLEEFMQKLDKMYSLTKEVQMNIRQTQFSYSKIIQQKSNSAIFEDQGNIQKQLYVVSVIGNQSSAKSTILNYLFGCNFATSSGRCTKGVYYTVVEIVDKIVIILDTEGLLSICGRDQSFDIQITSLIFKISDLVIINNKGQINSVTKNLLGVCMYVLKNLIQKLKYQDKKKTVKLLFALRDQCDLSSQVHSSMLAQIIFSLSNTQNSEGINFEDYFSVKSQDIFLFNSAIALQQKDTYFKQKNEPMFGKFTLIFRSKIYQLLQEPKYKSFKQFYQQAKIVWKSILKCGTQIFNFQSIFEIEVKKQINKACKKFQKQTQAEIKQLNQMIQNQKKIQTLIQKQGYVKSTYTTIQQTFQNKVKHQIRTSGKCSTLQWINHIIKRFRQNFARKKNHTLKILKHRHLFLKIQQQQSQFSEKITKILDSLDDTQQQEVYKHFSQLSSDIVLSFENQIKEKQQHYSREDTFNFITRTYWQLWYNINASYFSKTFFQLKKDLQNSLKPQYFLKIICPRSADLIKKFLSENAFAYWIKCIQNGQIQLEAYFKKIKDVSKLQNQDQIFKALDEIAYLRYNDYYKNCGLPLIYITSDLPELVYIALIYRVPQFIKKRHSILTKVQLNRKIALVENKKQNLKKALDLRGRFVESAQQWFKIINQKAVKFLQKKAKQIIANQINVEILSQLGGDKILIKATNESLLWKKQGSQKDKWVNCYKIISNVNYFLRQFFYSSPSVSQLKLIVQNLETELRKHYILGINAIRDILKIQKIEQAHKNLKPNQFLQLLSINMFEADFSMYNKRSIDQLKRICQQLQKMFTSFNQKQYFKTIYDKIDLKQVQKYLAQLLQSAEKQILGCQSICPICYMKCCLGRDHEGGHRVLQNSHTLICFAGYRYSFTGKVCKQMCFGTFDSGTRGYKNHLQFIKAQQPRWAQHFQKDPKQNSTNYSQLLKIWANIKDMAMKYAFVPGMQDDEKYDCLDQPLTQQDMQQKRLDQTIQKEKILSILSKQKQNIIECQYQLKIYKRLKPEGGLVEEQLPPQNPMHGLNQAFSQLNGLLKLIALLSSLQGQANQQGAIKIQIKKKPEKPESN